MIAPGEKKRYVASFSCLLRHFPQPWPQTDGQSHGVSTHPSNQTQPQDYCFSQLHSFRACPTRPGRHDGPAGSIYGIPPRQRRCVGDSVLHEDHRRPLPWSSRPHTTRHDALSLCSTAAGMLSVVTAAPLSMDVDAHAHPLRLAEARSHGPGGRRMLLLASESPAQPATDLGGSRDLNQAPLPPATRQLRTITSFAPAGNNYRVIGNYKPCLSSVEPTGVLHRRR